MVGLDTPLEYVWMFLIALGLGGIGGIAYELLQRRRGETGTIELPGRRPGRRFLDLGFMASIALGAIAAVAATYFFTPEVQAKVKVGDVEEIKTHWQIVRLVPLSLIVGSMPGAFLTGAQARILAKVKEQQLGATQAVGQAVVGQVAESVAAQTARAVAAKVQPAVERRVRAAAAGLPSDMHARFVRLQLTSELGDLLAREPADPDEHAANVQIAIEEAMAAALGDLEAPVAEQVRRAQQVIAATASG